MANHLPVRPTNSWTLSLIAVIVVALAARLVSIGYNFDGDEIFSLQLVSGSWSEVIARSLVDRPHPPLHNLLLHGWVSLWGISETKLRLLSVLLSIVAIVISMDILRQRVNAFGTLAAGLTIAVSAFFAYYNQEARPYALIFVASAFNIWAFLRLLAEPKTSRNAFLWAISAVILVWSHYIGAIYLAIEGCIFLFCFPLRLAIRAILPTLIAGGTILPWMWLAFHKSHDLHELAWDWPPHPRDLPDLYLAAIGWPPMVSGWLLLAAVAILMAAGAVRKYDTNRLPWDEFALAAIAVLPPVAVFMLSHLASTSIWAPRQLIPSALAFIFLLFILVDSLPKAFRLIAEGLLVIWSAAGFPDSYQNNRVPHWHDIVQRIQDVDPHSVILANEPWTLRPLLYYTRNTTLRVIDLRSNKAKLPNGELFGVCPYKRALASCNLLQQLDQGSQRIIEFARDPWNTAGGKPRDYILTYRIASGK